ncbi:M14 family metallopeptidase [Mucilaginibacter sp. BT774]|uniref:M14 family metallopeptidase n=1 Tax=Mucilaginibacter sp. BT774 TaxID=3062276 RepID=UPI002676FEEF|nr:M14 family metallopeptidase [Mucilaginibacter sp. BT774]MDO3628401.1 M14 family metallopeptidase [Mucilaginibacter sp. BT774]
MLKKISLSLFCLGFACMAFAQELQSPSEFLGYKLGSQFTPHFRIAEYFKYVASVSKNVKLQQYGSTNEGRPLMAMFIASDENIARLEEIRQYNLSLAGLSSNNTSLSNAPVIVWLSYNVHGNEPSSSEAAMQALYELANPTNKRTQPWFKNTVVVIDPCLNPDGRERYINYYNSVKGVTPNADPTSREHSEPWPGGRVNHYYFDLNRDWAWQTQKETKARLALFNEWLPQVHVDFHEQGYNAPYYFAPAAEPFHKDITSWQKEFQTIIGKNNAKYFDQNGWMYFTKEEFDLLYPSYGDTYPIYNGSIGMTYEQGGIGAGLAIATRSGDTLTLADRITHHLSNSLSTVETVSANASRALTEFKKYYDSNRANPPGEYKTYIIKNDNPDNLAMLAELLHNNGIKVGHTNKHSAVGFDYVTGKMEQLSIEPHDLVVNAYQPKSVLLNVLLEPRTFLADSNTYDITAWSLPYAYGLRAYGLRESIKPEETKSIETTSPGVTKGEAYAYVVPWRSVFEVKFLAELYKKNIKVRCSQAPFESAGQKFAAGSLIITRAGNNAGDFDEKVIASAKDCHVTLSVLKSGFVDKGADLGSSAIKSLHQPKVLLISGEGSSSEAMGEIWHFFDQEINYPLTIVKYHDLSRERINDFDVIIFPDGSYDDLPVERLQSWVHDGGKLIAMENTVSMLADKKGFSIKSMTDKHDTSSKSKENLIKVYADRDHDAIRSSVPGAIYKVDMDNTHPLGFGLQKYYFTLKLNDVIYNYLGDDGWNVGTIKKNGYVEGFVGQKAKEKLKGGLLFGVQSIGRGSVVYLVDDPIFRSFWQNGKLLFGNAVFMVGQ